MGRDVDYLCNDTQPITSQQRPEGFCSRAKFRNTQRRSRKTGCFFISPDAGNWELGNRVVARLIGCFLLVFTGRR